MCLHSESNMTADSSEYRLRISDMFRRDIFSIPKAAPSRHIYSYTENKSDYLWGTQMLKMALELQCCCVALIVMTQVWILVYFGSELFEKLIGDELFLPILYLIGIIVGTMTYVRPTYWKITLSLTVYSVCIYFSMMVTNVAIKILMTPELAGILHREPSYADSHSLRVWIPWAVGFALHMQFCISSFFISIVSIRDMYSFNPKVVSQGRGAAPSSSSSCGGCFAEAASPRRQTIVIPMESTTTTTVGIGGTHENHHHHPNGARYFLPCNNNNNNLPPSTKKSSLNAVFNI